MDAVRLPPSSAPDGASYLVVLRSRFAWQDLDADLILDVTAGVPHVFQSFVGQLDDADQALDTAWPFLTQQLTSP